MSGPPELAVLGGSFDPPHLGHVLLAAYALGVSEALDRVLVVPVYQHAFGKPLSAFEHRLRMCELAFQDIARVEVSSLERELGGTSRTLRLIEALEARYPQHQLRLLIGADILHESDKWAGFDEICRRAPLLVAGRAGFESAELDPRAPELPAISSTAVRAALRHGDDARLWVPARVRDYIQAHGLYAEAAAP